MAGDVDPANPTGVEERGIAGCMDPAYLEYDPAATINDPRMCITPLSVENIFNAAGFSIKTALNKATVAFPRPGDYRLRVTDVSGKTVYEGGGKNKARASFSTGSLMPGVYMLGLALEGKKYREKVVIME